MCQILTNWPRFSREENVFKFLKYFVFSVSFLCGYGRGLHLRKLKIPFTQRCFVPRLIIIGPVGLERKFSFFNFDTVSMLFCYYLSFERACSFIWTKYDCLHPGCYLPSLVNILWMVQEKILLFSILSIGCDTTLIKRKFMKIVLRLPHVFLSTLHLETGISECNSELVPSTNWIDGIYTEVQLQF